MIGTKPKPTDLRQEAERLAREADKQEAAAAAAQSQRDRAAFVARQAEHSAEQQAALADFQTTESEIVAAVVELQGLLQALTERRKQAALLGVVPAQSHVDRLTMGVRGALEAWRNYRPELVGNPPREDPHAVEVREARREVVRCEKMLADWQTRLTTAGEASSHVGAESLRRVHDWSAALQLARARLGKALASGPQDAQTRRERLALAEAAERPVTMMVPV
jgi:hypothetical protein